MKFPRMVVFPEAANKQTVLVIEEGLNVKLPKVCPIKLVNCTAEVYAPVILQLELEAQVDVVVPLGNVADEVAWLYVPLQIQVGVVIAAVL